MSETKIPALYRIETDRLLLRCFDTTDAPALMAAVHASREHLLPWMPWAHDEPLPVESKIAKIREFRSQFDRDESYAYGIFDKGDGRLLGVYHLLFRQGPGSMEFGYWNHIDEAGKGIITEVTKVMTTLTFNYFKLDRAEIRTDPNNVRSYSVAKRLGFTHEATMRRRMLDEKDGKFYDTMVWVLFTSEHADWPHKDVAFKAYDAIDRLVFES